MVWSTATGIVGYLTDDVVGMQPKTLAPWDRNAGPQLEYYTREYMRRGECDADGRNSRAAIAKMAQFAFALSLFSGMVDDARVRQLLRDLTHRYWGKIVGAQTIIAELRRVGVEIPVVISAG
jgi:hypothetical protein